MIAMLWRKPRNHVDDAGLHEVPQLRAALEKVDAGGDGASRQDFFYWYIHRLTKFERFSRKNMRTYRRLRVPALIASAVVPAVIAADPGPPARLAAVILSVFVAAATALEEFLSAGRRWRHYRATVEPLKAEGWMYVALAGRYAGYPDHEAAFPDFAERIGSALVQETEEYVSHAMVQSGAPSGTPTEGAAAQPPVQ